MTMVERAAQFAPFAALRGYDEEIEASNTAVDNSAYRDDLYTEDAFEHTDERFGYAEDGFEHADGPGADKADSADYADIITGDNN